VKLYIGEWLDMPTCIWLGENIVTGDCNAILRRLWMYYQSQDLKSGRWRVADYWNGRHNLSSMKRFKYTKDRP